MVTYQEVREHFHYEPSTGAFTWKKCIHPSRIGRQVGGPNSQGYICCEFMGRHLKVHRLIWLWMTGEWPKGSIDHINHQKSDNRWENLRVVDHSANMMNRLKPISNSSGKKGVSPFGKKWKAQITVRKKVIYLGLYETVDEAHEAYLKAARELHGEYHVPR